MSCLTLQLFGPTGKPAIRKVACPVNMACGMMHTSGAQIRDRAFGIFFTIINKSVMHIVSGAFSGIAEIACIAFKIRRCRI